jgi:hypothetical protein
MGNPRLRRSAGSDTEHVIVQRPLHRILAFTGYTIDDVVQNPIAKNAVLGYYKLHKQVARRCEIVDLEKQWSQPTAVRKGGMKIQI